jgi:hypothetical protein
MIRKWGHHVLNVGDDEAARGGCRHDTLPQSQCSMTRGHATAEKRGVTACRGGHINLVRGHGSLARGTSAWCGVAEAGSFRGQGAVSIHVANQRGPGASQRGSRCVETCSMELSWLHVETEIQSHRKQHVVRLVLCPRVDCSSDTHDGWSDREPRNTYRAERGLSLCASMDET